MSRKEGGRADISHSSEGCAPKIKTPRRLGKNMKTFNKSMSCIFTLGNFFLNFAINGGRTYAANTLLAPTNSSPECSILRSLIVFSILLSICLTSVMASIYSCPNSVSWRGVVLLSKMTAPSSSSTFLIFALSDG